MEIERKFLIPDSASGLPVGPWTALRQGYLATGSDGEVRLRDAGGVLTLTVKSGAGLVREEREIALTAAQFDALWPLTEGRRIEKRRAVVAEGEQRYEVDVFEGVLSGLMVAEVEFPGVDEARAFQPPTWFGAEVTDDARYSNASLARAGTLPAEATGR